MGNNSSGKIKDVLKYIGPGLLVTVGFIDPGNWASNIEAGSKYGYSLLWVVSLSTLMLILLQHNAAHLGIATGLCLSEAATKYLSKWISKPVLFTAVLASISTALAEILGGAIALNMLFKIPIKLGSVLIFLMVFFMLFSTSYRKTEKWIIGFVSIIGLSFIYEVTIVNIDWKQALTGWIIPAFPQNSIVIIMSVLGAVVMPHNIFLHSEVIQSRQWNMEDDSIIRKQLDYEFIDTLFSMIVGWAINSAMILMAAATFYSNSVQVTQLQQAEQMLRPLAGNFAALIFAVALLFSGSASSVTAGMAGGTIYAGIYGKPYNTKDKHTKIGIGIILGIAVIIIFLLSDVFKGLIISQMFLSIQLPFTIFLQIYLTSSKRIMGDYANTNLNMLVLLLVGFIVTVLNILLFISFFK
ncbi:MAG: Nramp family divalent metal transporter [Desulfobacterales bacterium]|nr:Nramp family divalent metal transporter [Desulfobacterales bacterium]MBF0398024.1 Nramp family divalent metal transporter [Desulfobacterales bacterium]